MSIDSIGDFLTIIRNGVMVSKPFVLVPSSKMKVAITDILQREGFIRGYEMITEDNKSFIKIMLKYVYNESVIHEITRISKLGGRCYSSIKRVKPVIGGLGISILTTSRGVLSHKEAKKLNVGGEVICTVW